ncbi:MAG: pyridoxamine 5'-phosphate oxidase [Bacteroidia bacterium]|nr:pyridoxamine 5'-phosphate oxidase [Bacteroidia bacterium]
MDLKDQRVDYTKFELDDASAGNDPLVLFSKWFELANQQEEEANIMILGTVYDNKPQNRIVLLKEVLDGEFVFYTNYESKKGKSIDENPNVSLLFFWQQSQRQVRIEGVARKVSAQQSDDYFYSRPIESQIGAIASSQSDELHDRRDLEQKVEELRSYYSSNPIKRPEDWGGYTVNPSSFEFWQGRSSRLHDRIVFEASESNWRRKRLYP